MKLESSMVSSVVQVLKSVYIRVPQIVVLVLFVIGLGAYAQQTADKPVISLSTVSKLDRSQTGIYRKKVGKIDVIAGSDGTVGLGLTKELIQNAKPGEVEHLLARRFEKSPLDASVNAFLIKYENKRILIDAGSSELAGPTAGKLPQSLRAAGAPPENITDIFVTHFILAIRGPDEWEHDSFSERDDSHQEREVDYCWSDRLHS
jgi:hypothetical protein